MEVGEIVKASIVGGLFTIVVVFLIGAVAQSMVYDLSFIALLVGGAIAGWMIEGKQEDAIVSGALSGLLYVVFGLFILFPLVSTYHSASPIGAIVVGIVFGLIGGFAGKYIKSSQSGSKKMSGRKR